MKLRHIVGRTYVIEAPVNIGVVRLSPTTCVLIDSGLDDDAGRRVKKVLTQVGWRPTVIINTHGHADHCGGNAYLKRQYACEVWASELERPFIEQPCLEPYYLFGARPMKQLRGKLVQHHGSKVDRTISAGTLEIENTRFRVHAVPGHSPGMLAIETQDKVLFTADAVFGYDLIGRYPMLFLYDLQGVYTTLEYIKTCKPKWSVPAHGPIVNGEVFLELVEKNERAYTSISQMILDYVGEGSTVEGLHNRLRVKMKLSENIVQFHLNQSVINAHLGYLVDSGSLRVTVTENGLVYSII